ncbi:hypothetical protein [Bdellovibrio sp. HCB337]|uniref:hypothetical protein n=1 Tax=Bdellovibrio sp. HCB337 TaxID=3394358 RepID=UPI0039A4165D
MKSILFAILTMMTASAMAVSVTQLHCETIDSETTVQIQFDSAVDPAKPFIGWPNLPATLEVRPYRSRNIYKTAIHFTPLKGGEAYDLRGSAAQEGVYLQLFPEIVKGEATGNYTGQAFINDLDARVYFDFRSEGSIPGLTCK